MPEAKETTGQIEYYSRAMKAPRIREAAARLADQAREGGWTHEEHLAAVLSREVAAREASGAETRARAAVKPSRFPAVACYAQRVSPHSLMEECCTRAEAS